MWVVVVVYKLTFHICSNFPDTPKTKAQPTECIESQSNDDNHSTTPAFAGILYDKFVEPNDPTPNTTLISIRPSVVNRWRLDEWPVCVPIPVCAALCRMDCEASERRHRYFDPCNATEARRSYSNTMSWIVAVLFDPSLNWKRCEHSPIFPMIRPLPVRVWTRLRPSNTPFECGCHGGEKVAEHWNISTVLILAAEHPPKLKNFTHRNPNLIGWKSF